MEKQEARSKNPDKVMFCHEGSFYTFYDLDAIIMNHLCGYKIIASGRRPKGGIPLKNTSAFEKLEKEKIPFFIFKRGDGIIKDFNGDVAKFKELATRLIEELSATGKTATAYFEQPSKTTLSQSGDKELKRGRLETLSVGIDPFTSKKIAMSDETLAWLKELVELL